MADPTSASPAQNGGMIGPMAGPQVEEIADGLASAPQSPYSTTKALMRDLTLPTVPNLNIPDSPPGSPPPGMDKKFSHFLELKKQGIHFNEKLANSSALKNPSLLGKLMTFAALEESDQYATTLPKETWDPQGFPPWAYHEELAKAQDEAQKEREKEMARTQREAIEFVSASGQSSRALTPGNRGLKGSAAERVMAGLDRTGKSSPQVGNAVASGSSNRRRSRSPGGRRRSRSR